MKLYLQCSVLVGALSLFSCLGSDAAEDEGGKRAGGLRAEFHEPAVQELFHRKLQQDNATDEEVGAGDIEPDYYGYGNNCKCNPYECKCRDGPPGPQGPDGPRGYPGMTGPSGPRGPNGGAGPQGDNGVKGPIGPSGPQGDKGPPGDMGRKGQRGPRGPQGIAGPKGAKGMAGAKGMTGQKGPRGPRGPHGPGGPQGMPGDQGMRGPKGMKGEKGRPGGVGPRGPEGPHGPQGMVGRAGMVGDKGPRGYDGEKGSKGQPGPTGPKGAQGQPGDQGPPQSAYKVGPFDCNNALTGDLPIPPGGESNCGLGCSYGETAISASYELNCVGPSCARITRSSPDVNDRDFWRLTARHVCNVHGYWPDRRNTQSVAARADHKDDGPEKDDEPEKIVLVRRRVDNGNVDGALNLEHGCPDGFIERESNDADQNWVECVKNRRSIETLDEGGVDEEGLDEGEEGTDEDWYAACNHEVTWSITLICLRTNYDDYYPPMWILGGVDESCTTACTREGYRQCNEVIQTAAIDSVAALQTVIDDNFPGLCTVVPAAPGSGQSATPLTSPFVSTNCNLDVGASSTCDAQFTFQPGERRLCYCDNGL